ncbi:MAG TPA: GNAT family N-acetyltransferase [Streptosporangiaceae bacterium]
MDIDRRFAARSLDQSQVAAWAQLYDALEQADHYDEYLAEADLRAMLDDPDTNQSRGSLAIYDGETMAAFGLLSLRPAADPVHLMFLAGGVHPAYRGRGLGTHVMAWADQAARPLHEERFAGRPLSLASRCRASDDIAGALFADNGYVPTRWFMRMTCDLTGDPPSAPVPDGVEIRGFTAERSADARQVHDEAFRDHWGSVDSSPESWAHFIGYHALRPEYSFLAYAGGEPVGMVLSHEYEAYTAATGRKDLYIPSVATRRQARKRGVASALLARVLASARADGFVAATLDVDSDSPTGAVGLYERAGFVHSDTWITQVKELIAGS